MKGIVLAGGKGTRLYPITLPVCKQLLPVYDKPMIYYPMSLLMLANIRDILIICNPGDESSFNKLFGNGKHLGLNISYAVQESPRGIAEAFIIGEEFIGDDSVCLVLGDNIFFGSGLSDLLDQSSDLWWEGAIIFGCHVSDPERYGIVELNEYGRIISIEEKPKNPKSNIAIPGLYFYNNKVVQYAKELKPSARGEIEITDINRRYLEDDELNVQVLGRGIAWLDAGTYDSLLQASNFVQTIQQRQGLGIAYLEEIAYDKEWITREQLLAQAEKMKNTEYGKYLTGIANGSKM